LSTKNNSCESYFLRGFETKTVSQIFPTVSQNAAQTRFDATTKYTKPNKMAAVSQNIFAVSKVKPQKSLHFARKHCDVAMAIFIA